MRVIIGWVSICKIKCTFYDGNYYFGTVRGIDYTYDDTKQTLTISNDSGQFADFQRIQSVKVLD